MKHGPWLWISGAVAAAGGLAVYLVTRKKAGSSASSAAGTDAQWLARVLMMEVADIGPGEEWAGLAHVALNRARRRGETVRQVVTAESWPGRGARGDAFRGAIASSDPAYSDRYGHKSPVSRRRWAAAQEFGRQVAAGEVANPIGSREQMVHPGRFPPSSDPQPNAGARKYLGRWLPSWTVPSEYGGAARRPPIKVGRALFA